MLTRIDETYTQILIYSIILEDHEKRDKVKLNREFRQIVGSVIVLFDSLPASVLARLLGITERTTHARLRSSAFYLGGSRRARPSSSVVLSFLP